MNRFLTALAVFALTNPLAAQERPIIMIDPGHGGDDVGVEHAGVLEKDLVLRLGFIIGEELVSRGYDVRLTRTGDYAVAWADRRGQAESIGAAMLFMLHFNGNEDTSLRGAEVRVYQAEPRSSHLASLVEAELKKLGAPAVTVDRDWGFLTSPTVPTVMIETAYMTNPVDGRRAQSPEFYRSVAERLADAADEFLGRE